MSTRRTGEHHSHELYPGANKLPFEQDELAQELVAEFAPMVLDEVGFILGITRERVRQVEKIALKKLARIKELRATDLAEEPETILPTQPWAKGEL